MSNQQKQTTTTNTVHFKIHSESGEIRRFKLSSPTIESLIQTTSDLFSVDPSTIKLSYKDDEGDEISLTSDAELSASFDFISDNDILHLNLSSSPSVPTPTSNPLETESKQTPSFVPFLPPRLRNKPFHRGKCRGKRNRGGIKRGGCVKRGGCIGKDPSIMEKKSIVMEKKRSLQQIRASKPPGKPSQEWKEKVSAAREELKEAQSNLQRERARLRMERMKEKPLAAQFVSHVACEDGTEYFPSTSFTKTWRFRNIGSESWPENTVLMRVSRGDDKMSAPSSIPIPGVVNAGDEVDVSVDLKACSNAGEYISFWRLATGDKKFGPRVRVKIHVIEPSSSESDEEKKVEEKKVKVDVAGKWEKEIELLREMGFEKNGRMVRLLNRHKGNVTLVVRDLLRKRMAKNGVF